MTRLLHYMTLGLVGLLSGCVPIYPDNRLPLEESSAKVELGARFTASETGTIRGRVCWTGDRPSCPPVVGGVPLAPGRYRFAEFPAPYTPQIGEQPEQPLGSVLVELVGIEPVRSKPMDLPAVQILLADGQIRLKSGDSPASSMAVCPCGASVQIVSQDQIAHQLRARGAAFFGLPFPVGAESRQRVFQQPGWVQLSSGVGYYWMAADLRVVEHPYYAVTSADGQFELTQVPAGRYELRFTMRDWRVTSQERDPETGLIFRQNYQPPLVQQRSVTVVPQDVAELSVHFSATGRP